VRWLIKEEALDKKLIFKMFEFVMRGIFILLEGDDFNHIAELKKDYIEFMEKEH
jgi:hypothetical protein